MRSRAEGKMRGFLVCARHIECVWVSESVWITVGRTDQAGEGRARWDDSGWQLQRFSGFPEHELEGGAPMCFVKR